MKRVAPVVLVLAALVIASAVGIHFLLEAIDDGKCRAKSTYALVFAGLLEEHRRSEGAYPVATDAATVKARLVETMPGWKPFIDRAEVRFESDGETYRLELF